MMRRAALQLVDTGPTENALDLEAVKQRLRGFEAADDVDDAALNAIIAAVCDYLDGERSAINRALISKTYDEKFSAWPCGREPLRLALAPVSEIVSVKYRDEDGVEQTFDAAEYEFTTDGDAGVVRALDAWPALDKRRMTPIVVRYVAGYGDSRDAIPPQLVESMTLIVGQLFEHRDALGVEALRHAVENDPFIGQLARASL